MTKKNTKHEYHYFRVVVTYSDGESSSNRVFKDRAKAERWAERQKKSAVVKKTSIEPFVRKPYEVAKVRSGPSPTSDI